MIESWGTLLGKYPHPLPLLLFAFFLSTGFTYLFYRLAVGHKLLPRLRDRDVHTVQKPRVGGVAMWLAIMSSFILVLTIHSEGGLSFGRQLFFGVDRALWGIGAGMVVILVSGLFDDIKNLPWPAQLGTQLLAALCLVAGGVTVSYIRLPLDQGITLNPLSAALFTIFWVMLMMNVMNWFDGLDGLAGSIALTAATALFFVSLQVGFIGTATLSLILAAAAAGFLVWNWYPSKLFMGTVGSQTLGFLLGAIALVSGGKMATAVLVLGIPVLDAVVVIGRRLLAKRSPFQADQRHLHHRLLKIGLPVPYVVILINIVGIIFGILAINQPQASTKGLLTLIQIGLMVIFISMTYILELKVKKS